MLKPKMASSLKRILFLATIFSAIMFVNFCEAGEMSVTVMQPGSGSIPDTQGDNQKGVMDAHNQPVTPGITGLASKLTWPATWSFLRGTKFFLENFIGQTFPCTIWQWFPPIVECSPMRK